MGRATQLQKDITGVHKLLIMNICSMYFMENIYLWLLKTFILKLLLGSAWPCPNVLTCNSSMSYNYLCNVLGDKFKLYFKAYSRWHEMGYSIGSK